MRPLINTPIMAAGLDIPITIVFGLIFYLVYDIVSDIISYSRKKLWISNVGNRELIQETIWFTNDILYEKKIRQFPAFAISYYKHRRFLGVYDNSKIIIYVKNATDAASIVGITLHEVNHYIQHQTNMKEYSKYEYYSLKFGNDQNPLEKESREFADKWTEPCLKHLLTRNVVKLQ